MNLHRVSAFTADFPNDYVIEGRKIVQVGGRTVAGELRGIVARLGCEPSKLEGGGRKGWGFTFEFKGVGFWCHVQSFFPALYLSLFPAPGRDRGPEEDKAHEDLWGALDSALQADGRFHDIQWYPTFGDAPPPPEIWIRLGLWPRKPPGFLATWVARPLGWLALALGALAFLDFVTPAPLTGLGYLLASAFLLSTGYKVSHVFGVRVPWVRLP